MAWKGETNQTPNWITTCYLQEKSLFEPPDLVSDGFEYYLYESKLFYFTSKVSRKITAVFIGFSNISLASQKRDPEDIIYIHKCQGYTNVRFTRWSAWWIKRFPVLHMSKADWTLLVSSKWFSSLFPQSQALKEAFCSCLTWNLFYDLEMKCFDLGGRGGRLRGRELFLMIWYCIRQLLSFRQDLILRSRSSLCHYHLPPTPSCFLSRQLRGITEYHLHHTASYCSPGLGKLIVWASLWGRDQCGCLL